MTQFGNWLKALLFILLACLPAFGFDLTHPSGIALARRVHTSLHNLDRFGRVQPDEIEAIQLGYLSLPRAEMSADELVEIKYFMQQWRYHVKPAVPKGRAPSADLPIFPVKGSRFGWEVWSADDRFTLENYQHADGVVTFKGVPFRSGDVVLVDENQAAGDGIMTSVVDEPRLAAHLGTVVFLKRDGKTFPAVVEIHEFGLRAIPLSLFFAPRFTNYAEVFRLREAPNVWENKLADAAAEMLSRPHAYDLWANEDDDRYLTCSAVALHLLKNSGASLPTVRSTLGTKGFLRENLARLGVTRDKFLMPGDFARDGKFKMVGVVDSGTLAQNLLNELFSRAFADLLRDRVLNPDLFPFGFRVNRWGLGQLDRGTWPGRLLIWYFGFTKDTLPSGPHDLMALYKVLEPRLKKAAGALTQTFTCEVNLGGFANHDSEKLTGLISLHKMFELPGVRRHVLEKMDRVARLFELPPSK